MACSERGDLRGEAGHQAAARAGCLWSSTRFVRAARGDAVGPDDGAGVQRGRANELELGGDGRPEQQVGGGGLADEQRVYPEPQLVEQTALEQGVGQLSESVLHDVLARLLLQPADLRDRVAADYRGVVPLRIA